MLRVPLGLVFLLLLHPAVNAQQPNSAADETRLIALENAWNQAQVHHDAKALESLVGASFVYTDTDGTVMNKAQFLTDAKDMSFQASSVTNDNVKVDLYSNAAVVSGRYHIKGTYKGKPFNHYGRFTDMWIYQNSEWQCVASHTTLLQK
jgi:ketosteroid isomerase-like protein